MLRYKPQLKNTARRLHSNTTEAECLMGILHAAIEVKLEIPPNPPLQRGELGSAKLQGKQSLSQVPFNPLSQREELGRANLQGEQSSSQAPIAPLSLSGELSTANCQAEPSQLPRPKFPPFAKGG